MCACACPFFLAKNNWTNLTFWLFLYLLVPAEAGLCLQTQNTVVKAGRKKQTFLRKQHDRISSAFRIRLQFPRQAGLRGNGIRLIVENE